MIAALYVETNGCYFGLDGIDPWDEVRDARRYAGPWPVVAHPPCERWSVMGRCRGYYDGEDNGCFAAALKAVRAFGGVIEHPAQSLAWTTFGLPLPGGLGWTSSIEDIGWSCFVDQRHYGHEANKPTWLYYVGSALPPALRWGRASAGVKTISRSYGGGRQHLRARTPIPFRDLLISIARSASLENREAA